MNRIAIHRTFEGELKGEPIYYVADGTKTTALKGPKIDKFFHALNSDTTLITSGQFDQILVGLAANGVRIFTAPWHATGIEKGLEPAVIAERFFALNEDLLREVNPRPDILQLRTLVQARAAFIQFRKKNDQQIMAISRGLGLKDEDDRPEWLSKMEAVAKDERRLAETPIDKQISKLASKIEECITLNDILGVSDASWMTSAYVISFLGDVGRFPMVSSLWHYAGYHVTPEGKAPKRSKGSNISWNPKLRTALWSWSDSMLKTMNPVWRPVYDKFLAEELAVHDQKHPACKTKQGHCGARARRKVVKEVLKTLFAEAHRGQKQVEIQHADAMTASASA